MRWFKLLLMPVALLLLTACSVERQVTISTTPPDATLRIDSVDRGKAPLTEKFIFNSNQDVHRVTATRAGYKDQTVTLTRDYDTPTLQIDLKPLTKRVTFNIEPAAAKVSIDGRPVASQPVSTHSTELEFTLDNSNRWTTYTITAERPGFEKAQQTITWTDPSPIYTITLEPKKKTLEITTTPPRAEILLDGVKLGSSPVSTAPVPFPIDLQSNTVIPRKITASKPGYDPIELSIGWDEGRSDYHLDFVPKTKTIKVSSNPPGAEISLKGVQGVKATVDNKGVYTFTLSFPPVNEKGDLITFPLTATKAPADGIEWYPGRRTLAWDNGKTDYVIDLQQVGTKPVSLLLPEMAFGTEEETWKLAPRLDTTTAMRDPAEPQSTQADLMVAVRANEFINSLTVSPDGNTIAYSVLTGKEGGRIRGQLCAVQVSRPGSVQQLTDGRSLDIMPSFTPDGKQIVFATDRNGRRVRIARMNTDGSGGIEHITTEDANDLWPVIDADPKPRLYFERRVEGRPEPRIYQTTLGTNTRTDLTPSGGSEPRVSPSNDAIVFTLPDKTGKRDIYRLREGKLPENLTNSPDVDEYDPIYSRDGSKIAFSSDEGVIQEATGNMLDNGSPETREVRNYDIWVMDATTGAKTQITTNGSLDDSPAWNFDGSLIFFRSNRGAQWGIWRIKSK